MTTIMTTQPEEVVLAPHAEATETRAHGRRDLRQLASRALRYAMRNRFRLGSTWADLTASARLLRAYAQREYTSVPWKSIMLIAGAIAYFVSPLDAVPDLLPVGLLDDATVIGLVLAQVRRDLDRFLSWESTANPSSA